MPPMNPMPISAARPPPVICGELGRNQRVGSKYRQENSERDLQDTGIGMGEEMHADRNTRHAAEHERPDTAEIHVLALRPDRARVQQNAAAGDQDRGMQRVDAMQPDRGGRESESKTAGAGGDAAQQRAEPQDGKRVERKTEQHPVSPDGA